MAEHFNPSLSVIVQTFGQLTTRQLYQILKVRAAVFVVEQNCPYQDLDDIDFEARHITLWQGDTLVAYSRVYQDAASGMWHIGRVLTTQRKQNFGLRIMHEALRVARELGVGCIEIEAQSYAIPFYERFGFRISSEEYLLDGILHTRMLVNL